MTEIEKDRSSSVWEDEIVLPHCKSLDRNTRTQVCVVGGGIAGLSTAYQLGKRGHKVTLLEGARIGSGQTGRTTAHLTYQLEEMFIDLIKQHDEETLSLFADSHRKAINVVEDIIYQESISCDFRHIDGYLFLGPDHSVQDLKNEMILGKKLGLDLSLMDEVPSMAYLGPAVRFPRQGQFHPLKYLAGLLRAVKELGVEVFENTLAQEFKTSSGGTVIRTRDGFEVHAEKLVVATDSPVNNRFYIHTKQAAYRTYVVGFKMLQPLEIPLLWDTADPYHYIRQHGNNIIIGGEDHRSGHAPHKDPYKELETWARERFPFLGKVTHRWSGHVFEPVDQIGYIGRNPGLEKNVFIVTGSSGIGMTNGTVASLIIADLIEDKPNPWSGIYDPSRINFRGARDFLVENSQTAYQYTDWITGSEVNTPEDIPLDQGNVIREGLTKTCVYHTKDDGYERKSAVCTHLGGIVHWNEIEKTWDCPCHGSRFNTHGQVIEGPAHTDLREH